jgi:hypothetical protein
LRQEKWNYNIPKVTEYCKSSSKRKVMSKEVNSKIKNPPKESPRHDGFIAKFYQAFKEELIPILLKLF